MAQVTRTLEEALALALALSPVDKLRLIERVAETLEREVDQGEQPPKRSLRGLWEGVSISAQEIDEARHEMWKNFPREDI
jgi:hypothetical protein